MINGFFALVLAFVFVGGPVIIRQAIQYDRTLAELEALEDGSLAAETWDGGRS